jgi:hypothetical protein
MTDSEKKEFLKSRGWSTWYNENYWVNPAVVVDKKRQDHTNYGMDLESAYFHEINELGPFDVPLGGIPRMSMVAKGMKHIDKIEEHFKE